MIKKQIEYPEATKLGIGAGEWFGRKTIEVARGPAEQPTKMREESAGIERSDEVRLEERFVDYSKLGLGPDNGPEQINGLGQNNMGRNKEQQNRPTEIKKGGSANLKEKGPIQIKKKEENRCLDQGEESNGQRSHNSESKETQKSGH
ncbi:hypothetical protein L6452_36777 [Arctium lappa]|uniref:Uncharacterized protein n=1 Tax=Arctium lappa TaxID=4217 RepID=A0ACB8Y1K8_ARCLA|nr:hypothetical protein L6452_36777 [Arctium lappa]